MLNEHTYKNRNQNLLQDDLVNIGYGEILKEIIQSTKGVIASEVALATAELKQVTKDTSKDLTQVAIFGGLLVLSTLPFIAFLVIGLGELLDDRYWLSSLIVAVVFAVVGGVMALRAFKKIKEHDLNFSATKNSLRREKLAVQSNFEKIKTALKGDSYGSVQLH